MKNKIIFGLAGLFVMLSSILVSACYSDIECSGGGRVPVTNTQYKRWECLDGQCVLTGPYTVECTTNAICPSDRPICSKSDLNYGECAASIAGPYCGDKTCDLGETITNCPQDCNPNYDLEQKLRKSESISNKSPYIIGAFILVGLLVIAYVISKKKK